MSSDFLTRLNTFKQDRICSKPLTAGHVRLAALGRLQAATPALDQLAGSHPYCETFVELFETAGIAPESLGLESGDVELLDEMRREEGFDSSGQ
ncbi:hypothetical protein ACFRCX_30505 [Streptomyces sp. NPDC056652]|uniref:hypothetical protein n=1 Tax=Streptomyces sp. NPDC056652 TaxID=3345893 RepID=UPI0036C42D35